MRQRRDAAGGPDQSRLDDAVRGSTQLRVHEVIGGRLLLEVTDPAEVALLASLLQIRPGDPFRCMCPGDQVLEFLGPCRRRTEVTLHHGRSLRWDAWDTDVLLDDAKPLLDWLAERGVTAPRDEAERIAVEDRRTSEMWEAWKRAAPACLAPILDEVSALGGVPPDVDEPAHLRAAEAIHDAFPEERAAILALLGWLGSGSGQWSSFPSYEAVPEWLLLRYSTEAIAAALEGGDLSPRQMDGAGRLLASYWFGRLRQGDAVLISERVLERLLAHAEGSPFEDDRARLRHALGR